MLKGEPSLEPLVSLLTACVEHLSEGVPLYRAGLVTQDQRQLKEFFFLTNKPVLAVVNIGEEQIGQAEKITARVAAELNGAEVIALSVQLEAEAVQLDDADRVEMLKALGLGEGAVPRFLTSAYHLLGLRTFLTTGEKESRAWTFPAGATAPECAGVIHSDLQRGFIRAETIAWVDLLGAGSWSVAKERGKVRAEGKDYLVCDGDVIEFRFAV